MRFSHCLSLVALLAVCSAAQVYAADTTPVAMDDVLTLQIPSNWEKVKPDNNLRLGQFKLPAAEGETEITELAVFPPFGGSVNENLMRWEGQFSGAEKKSTKGKTAEGKPYYLLDLTGTYKKPDGPPILRKTVDKPDYRMLAVIIETTQGNYFLKLTGPKKSVEAQVEAFRKSYGGDAAKEEAYEIK